MKKLLLLLLLLPVMASAEIQTTTYDTTATGINTINVTNGFNRSNNRMSMSDFSTWHILYQSTSSNRYRAAWTSNGGGTWTYHDTIFVLSSGYQPSGGIYAFGTDVYAGASLNTAAPTGNMIRKWSGGTLGLLDTIATTPQNASFSGAGLIELGGDSILTIARTEDGATDTLRLMKTSALGPANTWAEIDKSTGSTLGGEVYLKVPTTTPGMVIGSNAGHLYWADADHGFDTLNLGSGAASYGTQSFYDSATGSVTARLHRYALTVGADSTIYAAMQHIGESLWVRVGVVADGADGDNDADTAIVQYKTTLVAAADMPTPLNDTGWAEPCISCIYGTDSCIVTWWQPVSAAAITPQRRVGKWTYDKGQTWGDLQVLWTGGAGEYYNWAQQPPQIYSSGGTVRLPWTVKFDATNDYILTFKTDFTSGAAAPTTGTVIRTSVIRSGVIR